MNSISTRYVFFVSFSYTWDMLYVRTRYIEFLLNIPSTSIQFGSFDYFNNFLENICLDLLL